MKTEQNCSFHTPFCLMIPSCQFPQLNFHGLNQETLDDLCQYFQGPYMPPNPMFASASNPMMVPPPGEHPFYYYSYFP